MGSNRKERRERRKFSAAFKAEAVKLVAERRAAGGTLAQVARELDVGPDQLREWARQAREATGAGAANSGETLEQENRRLRRENATLRQEQSRCRRRAPKTRFKKNSARYDASRAPATG